MWYLIDFYSDVRRRSPKFAEVRWCIYSIHITAKYLPSNKTLYSEWFLAINAPFNSIVIIIFKSPIKYSKVPSNLLLCSFLLNRLPRKNIQYFSKNIKLFFINSLCFTLPWMSLVGFWNFMPDQIARVLLIAMRRKRSVASIKMRIFCMLPVPLLKLSWNADTSLLKKGP